MPKRKEKALVWEKVPWAVEGPLCLPEPAGSRPCPGRGPLLPVAQAFGYPSESKSNGACTSFRKERRFGTF